MDTVEASTIQDDFRKYYETGNKKYIKKYSLQKLRAARTIISNYPADINKPAFQLLEKRIRELETPFFLRGDIWPNIIVGIIVTVISSLIIWFFPVIVKHFLKVFSPK